VGQDGILRADGIGARSLGGLLSSDRPIDNRPQDAILPHNYGTGSIVPSATVFLHRYSRLVVRSKPAPIPNRRTDAIEYSEQVG
jgi:hypothetical protein